MIAAGALPSACSAFSAEETAAAQTSPDASDEAATAAGDGSALDATESDDAAQGCFRLQDDFARDTPKGGIWPILTETSGATVTVSSGDGGILRAQVPALRVEPGDGKAFLRSETAPKGCGLIGVELRFRARAHIPIAVGLDGGAAPYMLATEIKWPGDPGGKTNTVFLRVRDGEARFVYQEQDAATGGGGPTRDLARCAVDAATFREYVLRVDFRRRDTPWTIDCDGYQALDLAPLRATHQAGPFFVQAGLSYERLADASWVELDSISAVTTRQ